jgi:hypothetical protein
VWQVQDSNLRRHTPTDLQNDDAHAVTCGVTAPPPDFGTISPRLAFTALLIPIIPRYVLWRLLDN